MQVEGEQAYVNVRKAFVAPAGYCVVSADFCQLELRLMAHFSGDNALICMLNDPVWDPFVKLASRWKVGFPLLKPDESPPRVYSEGQTQPGFEFSI